MDTFSLLFCKFLYQKAQKRHLDPPVIHSYVGASKAETYNLNISRESSRLPAPLYRGGFNIRRRRARPPVERPVPKWQRWSGSVTSAWNVRCRTVFVKWSFSRVEWRLWPSARQCALVASHFRTEHLHFWPHEWMMAHFPCDLLLH